jgi:transcriptional regulator with XRE-family HTH domain
MSVERKFSEKDVIYNIKKVREFKNYTQEFMAECLGISTKSYSNIETGESKLYLDRLIKICETLEISIERILNLECSMIFNNYEKQSGYFENAIFSENGYIEAIKSKEELISYLKEQIDILKKTNK